MYLAGVNVRRVESITEVLWGTKVSPGTVSKLTWRIYSHIERWRTRPITGTYAYVYLDGVVLKRSWGGEVRNISVLVAFGVDQNGYRSILGVAEGAKEDKAGWGGFLKYLKERGLTGVKLIISDACLGLVESIGEFYPEAQWQRCTVHFCRNVFSQAPRGKVAEVSRMLKAIHAQEDLAAVRDKAHAVLEKLRVMKLRSAADLVERIVGQTLTYYHFPQMGCQEVPEHGTTQTQGLPRISRGLTTREAASKIKSERLLTLPFLVIGVLLCGEKNKFPILSNDTCGVLIFYVTPTKAL